MKEDALTWGDLDGYVIAVEKSAEVIVVDRKRADTLVEKIGGLTS